MHAYHMLKRVSRCMPYAVALEVVWTAIRFAKYMVDSHPNPLCEISFPTGRRRKHKGYRRGSHVPIIEPNRTLSSNMRPILPLFVTLLAYMSVVTAAALPGRSAVLLQRRLTHPTIFEKLRLLMLRFQGKELVARYCGTCTGYCSCTKTYCTCKACGGRGQPICP